MSVKSVFRSVFIVMATIMLVMVVPVSAEMRIFELQHKPAADLAEMVRQLVSENAKVAAHRNTLVVNSTPTELAEVAKLVQSYDRPLQMLRITVEQGRSTDKHESNISAQGRLEHGNTRVRVGGHPGPTDNSVFVSTGGTSVRLSGQSGKDVEKRTAKQFLTVLEGSSASISIGRAVPFTSQLRYYSKQHPHFVESVNYQNVDTGFDVFPEAHGDMVRLEIRPYMNFLDRYNSNHIVFHEMATTVNIPFGFWYDLGGQIKDQNGLAREILRAGSSHGSVANSIRIRVDSNP